MKTILVVDDEPAICRCLKAFFEPKNFIVHAAYKGSEAIEWLSRNQVDIVLIDMKLPDMSGLDVLKQARDLKPDAKIVMVTGCDQSDFKDDATVYGANAYLTKPFDFSDTTWSCVLEDES